MSIESIQNSLLKLNKCAMEGLESEIKSEFREIFHEYPDLDSFSWVQYTDYFNDGDVCNFNVHCSPEYGLEINGGGEESYVIEDENLIYKEGSEWVERAFIAISELLETISSEYMKNIYGDHIKVVVSRNLEIIKEHYDHD